MSFLIGTRKQGADRTSWFIHIPKCSTFILVIFDSISNTVTLDPKIQWDTMIAVIGYVIKWLTVDQTHLDCDVIIVYLKAKPCGKSYNKKMNSDFLFANDEQQAMPLQNLYINEYQTDLIRVLFAFSTDERLSFYLTQSEFQNQPKITGTSSEPRTIAATVFSFEIRNYLIRIRKSRQSDQSIKSMHTHLPYVPCSLLSFRFIFFTFLILFNVR